jgi:hypothetical protein
VSEVAGSSPSLYLARQSSRMASRDFHGLCLNPNDFSSSTGICGAHLSMFALAPEGVAILQDHENLSGWLARIEVRPSMKATTWDKLLERVAAAA